MRNNVQNENGKVLEGTLVGLISEPMNNIESSKLFQNVPCTYASFWKTIHHSSVSLPYIIDSVMNGSVVKDLTFTLVVSWGTGLKLKISKTKYDRSKKLSLKNHVSFVSIVSLFLCLVCSRDMIMLSFLWPRKLCRLDI